MEISLTQSNEKMSAILRESRNLEAQATTLAERTEKLKLAQKRIESLEKELTEKKELLAATEKQKMQLTLEKNELEDKEFTVANKLKQVQMRY